MAALPTAAPDLARVVCGTDQMTSLATPVVRPRSDGVHIETTNATSTDRSIDVEEVGGGNAPIGVSETVWQVGPGTTRVRCFDGRADAGADVGWVSLTVIDPVGLYRSAELDCSSSTLGTLDYGAGAPGQQGDPVALTKALVTGLRPADVVETAGYPEATERLVRIVREGAVVAWFGWTEAENGGWLLDTESLCGGTGIGLPSTG